MNGPLFVYFPSYFKPSAHSTTFVAGNRDLVFCRQRRKRISSIFDIEDRRQRQKSFICASRTQQVFVASDKNLRPQRQQSFICASRTQQVLIASDKNLRPQRGKSCSVRSALEYRMIIINLICFIT